MIQLEVLAAEARDVEPLAGDCMAALAQLPALVGVGQESSDRRGEGVSVPRRHEQAGFAVDHGLGYAADVARNDRQAGRHGLEDRHRQALRAAR